MIHNKKSPKQKDNRPHIYKPRFINPQPVVTGRKKGRSWLSWLGLGLSLVLAVASFGFASPLAGVAIGLADAAIQIGIAAEQGSLSALDIAINAGLGIIPIGSAIRASSRAGAKFAQLEYKAIQKGLTIGEFTIKKRGGAHFLNVIGEDILITSKQATKLRSISKLDQFAKEVTHTGRNSSALIKVALKGDLAGGALGKSTRQSLLFTEIEDIAKLERTTDSFLMQTNKYKVSQLTKKELRELNNQLRFNTNISQRQIGMFLREKLPATKISNLTRSELESLKKLSFSERLAFQNARKLKRFKSTQITQGMISVNTGKIRRINAKLYYQAIQAIHFLDPKLAARKILTKMQYYAKKFVKRKALTAYTKQEKTWAIGAKKWITKMSNVKWLKPFQRAIRQRMGVLIREVSEQMIYFPESQAVRGIRVIPLLGIVGRVHVIVFFKARATNGKSPVVLNNIPVTEVEQWIAASSKMGYYLDNYALSRGGAKLGFAVRGTMGALLGFLPLNLLRAHLSLSSNVVKLGKIIKEGKYGEEWREIWKTFERLGPHKLGKFVFGRYGIALVRGFQHTDHKSGRTTFSFTNEFKWEPLEEAVFRKGTTTVRKTNNPIQRQLRREQRFIQQYSRVFTQTANLAGRKTSRKRR